MRTLKSWTPFVVCALVATASALSIGSSSAAGAPRSGADNKYIGADKCKSCHGDQYGHWKQMKHATAFDALASEEAKKIGAEKSIADPQKSDACVKCHVTAFGAPEAQIKKGFDRTGVQCEACHGPGEQHMKARFAAAAKGDAAEGYVQVPADEIIAVPKQETCLACHNSESPTFKEFCFHEFNAKIRHLNPKKPRTEVDIGACSCPKCASGCPEAHKELAKVK